MAPLYMLIISLLSFRLFGVLGWSYFISWHASLQAAVAVMLLLTASAHFGKRRPDLIRMVPSWLPEPGRIVTITGWLELAAAAGILIPGISQLTSICLVILLIAMFPANIQAARQGLTINGKPTPPLGIRSLLQIIFVVAVLIAG
jgi:uncharacterized membrane protein